MFEASDFLELKDSERILYLTLYSAKRFHRMTNDMVSVVIYYISTYIYGVIIKD